MSATLGQIHHWLFSKIRYTNELELDVANALRKVDGDLVPELYESVLCEYGAPLAFNARLEDIIDHDNIHGWLQKQIEVSNVRLGTFLRDVRDTMGVETVDVPICKAFADQGRALGRRAASECGELTAPEVYDVMQNFYVNGMPCDPKDTILESTPEKFTWVADYKNLAPYWQAAGLSVPIMHHYYLDWFKGFIETVSNRKFTVHSGLDSKNITLTIE